MNSEKLQINQTKIWAKQVLVLIHQLHILNTSSIPSVLKFCQQ